MLTARAPQCSQCNRLLPWPDVERGDKVCSNCREPVEPPAELTRGGVGSVKAELAELEGKEPV